MDFSLSEKMPICYEQIHKRISHASGCSTHSILKLHESLVKYTIADFLNDTTVGTRLFVCISTEADPSGSLYLDSEKRICFKILSHVLQNIVSVNAKNSKSYRLEY
jgi:catalase